MPEILHQLLIKTLPDRVYSALTQELGLAEWWTRDVSAKPEEGAINVLGFHGHSIVFSLKVEAIEASAKVLWLCVEGHEQWIDTRIVFDLREHSKGTTLHFSHTDRQSTGGIFAQCSFDWARYLLSLKEYLETGKGKPHED